MGKCVLSPTADFRDVFVPIKPLVHAAGISEHITLESSQKFFWSILHVPRSKSKKHVVLVGKASAGVEAKQRPPEGSSVAVAPALAGPRGIAAARNGERGPNTPDKRCNGNRRRSCGLPGWLPGVPRLCLRLRRRYQGWPPTQKDGPPLRQV